MAEKKPASNRFAALSIKPVAATPSDPAIGKSDKTWMMSVKLDSQRYTAIKALAQKNKEAGIADLGSAQGIFLAALDRYLNT